MVTGERGRKGEGGRVEEVYLAERKVADQKISGSNVAELRRPEATTKDPRSDMDKRVPHLDLFFFLFLSVHSSIFFSSPLFSFSSSDETVEPAVPRRKWPLRQRSTDPLKISEGRTDYVIN